MQHKNASMMLESKISADKPALVLHARPVSREAFSVAVGFLFTGFFVFVCIINPRGVSFGLLFGTIFFLAASILLVIKIRRDRIVFQDDRIEMGTLFRSDDYYYDYIANFHYHGPHHDEVFLRLNAERSIVLDKRWLGKTPASAVISLLKARCKAEKFAVDEPDKEPAC